MDKDNIVIKNRAYEYLCPYCSGVNTFVASERNALKEELIRCGHCSRIMNVTAAHGMNEGMNVVAFEHFDETDSR